MILVSLLDVKADTYSPPHVTMNEETAKREFAMLLNEDKSKSLVAAHPEDFILFSVGEWCERVPICDGRFVAKLAAYQEFKALAKGIDLVAKE